MGNSGRILAEWFPALLLHYKQERSTMKDIRSADGKAWTLLREPRRISIQVRVCSISETERHSEVHT